MSSFIIFCKKIKLTTIPDVKNTSFNCLDLRSMDHFNSQTEVLPHVFSNIIISPPSVDIEKPSSIN